MKITPAPFLALGALLLIAAADRPQSTPLDGEQLFISPCGQPFRSASGQPYPVVQWFKQVDTDHDGKIDKAEFRAEAEAFFNALDKNSDGIVSDPEIGYYERVMVPEINAGVSPDAPGTDGADQNKLSGDPQGAAVYSLINDAEPVRSADRSFIGRISLKMVLARADQNFATLDEKGRGYLTLEDLPRTPAQKAATLARRR